MNDRTELMALIRHVFNVGMTSGMKEYTSSKGGATWQESKPDFEARLTAIFAKQVNNEGAAKLSAVPTPSLAPHQSQDGAK